VERRGEKRLPEVKEGLGSKEATSERKGRTDREKKFSFCDRWQRP